MKKIAVIGNVFVDIKGMSFGAVHKDAKNLGRAVFSHGGVGRNVAQNLSALGIETTFISTVTKNAIGYEVINVLQKNRVNTKYIRQFEEDGMGMWIAILDHTGDLISSISHQPNYKQLEETVFDCIEEVLESCNGIAIDLDLTYPISQKIVSLCKKADKPVFGVIGNLSVVKNHSEILRDIKVFVCSKEEAEILLGKTIEDIQDGYRAVQELGENGAEITIVTLGELGSLYYDRIAKRRGYCSTRQVVVLDTTGAGDAYFAGVVASLISGENIEQAMQKGTDSALQVIQSKDSALTRVEVE